MDQPVKLTHLEKINKDASIDQLRADYAVLQKYHKVYDTFESALDGIKTLIKSIKEE